MNGVTAFDRFIAIDWSGARGAYDGIAVAECRTGANGPVLLPPPSGRRWTRGAVAEWIEAEAGRGPRMLVGIDCAFSLPFAVAAGYLPAGGDARALWALVDRVAAEAPDFHGAGFARHADYVADFWHRGPRPAGWAEPHRAAEMACRRDGLGAPDSPFKQFGPKTVGPGALAGMRVLHHLRTRLDGQLAIWPFEAPAAHPLVLVEIFPRLFWRRAGRTASAKVRDRADLDAALARLGSGPAGAPDPLTDHATDALIAAAGLRALAVDPAVWSPPGLDPATARTEGWIFGVRG
ncbi:hypothetical protein KXR53_00285 [Inquilinus limosus]